MRQHRQYFVIAREQRDRGDPVIIMHARMRATLFTWILGSASTHATRRAGPGPQDDMFLGSFYFKIVFIFVVVFRKKKSKEKLVTPWLNHGAQVIYAVAPRHYIYTLYSSL